ncbi:MAG: tetratricopeptide repeat protein [Candidatus Latescibacterota bacterium]
MRECAPAARPPDAGLPAAARLAGAWRLGVLAAALLAYGSSVSNPFHYDDFHSIVNNPYLRSLGNLPRFFVDPTLFSRDPAHAMYRPLLLASYAVSHALGGYQVWSWHAVSLLLHAGCSLLVAELGLVLLGQPAAILAGLLFAVHPANSEAVNYLSSRSEILAALFVLLGLWVQLRPGRDGPGRAAGVAAALGAGLLCKSTAIALPFLLLAHDLVTGRGGGCAAGADPKAAGPGTQTAAEPVPGQARGCRPAGGAGSPPARRWWPRYRLLLYGSQAAVVTAYLLASGALVRRAVLEAPVRPYAEQVWTQVKAAVFYLGLLVQPTRLSVDHQFLISDSPLDPFAGSALLLLVCLAGAAWAGRRRWPLGTVLAAWFLLALAPSSLVPLRVLVNEHRLYLPGAVFALAVAAAAQAALSAGRRPRGVALLAAAVLASAAGLAWDRSAVWSDPFRLWTDAAAKAPLMARPQFMLAEACAAQGRPAAALAALARGLQRDPGFAPAYARMAQIHLGEGHLEVAVQVLQRGLAALPHSADLWSELGDAHRRQERWEECARAYARAVELAPANPDLRNNLGNAWQVLGRPALALEQHRQAVALDSSDARTWLNLGNAHLMLGQEAQAAQAYGRAAELDPVYAQAWLSLAGVHERRGERSAALAAYARAAQADPQYAALQHRKERELAGGTP